MEGCEVAFVRQLSQIPRKEVKKLLQSESGQLEFTKSLLNLLHNIVVVGSVPVSSTQKAFFDSHSNLVLSLLSKSKSLSWKKHQLEKNVALIINIAASCPTVAGS